MITHFVARLKSQAMLCEFKVKRQSTECRSDVNYAEEMVSNQMIAGLQNHDHQSRILSEIASLETFQLKFDKLVSLETTEKPSSHLQQKPNTTSSMAPQKSQYQRRKFVKRISVPDKRQPQSNEDEKNCKGCGRTWHPGGKSMSRSNCPAIDKECLNCGIKGHLQWVCKKPKKNSSAAATEISNESEYEISQSTSVQSFIFGTKTQFNENQEQQSKMISDESKTKNRKKQLRKERNRKKRNKAKIKSERNYTKKEEISFATSVKKQCSMKTTKNYNVISHGIWKEGEFQKAPPAKSPLINIAVKLMPTAHAKFGKRWKGSHKSLHQEVMMRADTGAQICTADPTFLEKMNCPKEFMIATNHKINGITNSKLDVQ